MPTEYGHNHDPKGAMNVVRVTYEVENEDGEVARVTYTYTPKGKRKPRPFKVSISRKDFYRPWKKGQKPTVSSVECHFPIDGLSEGGSLTEEVERG
jgi:hypothetical protein